MPSLRIIACLDVLEGKVVKGVKFKDHRVIGDPVELALRYSNEGIDELVFYDIGASVKGSMFDPELVKKIARSINIPFCVAGGISTLEQARLAIRSGADKISLNSAALMNPKLIDEIARDLGTQAVVVGVDVRDNQVFRLTGSEKSTYSTNRNVFHWCKEIQERGCGEIVLNCMDYDGTKSGTNIDILKNLANNLSVPIIASGGIGSIAHFLDAFNNTKVSGVLAASVFHDRLINIQDLKSELRDDGLEIRI